MLWPHVLQDVAIPDRGRGMLEDESQLHDLGRRDISVRPFCSGSQVPAQLARPGASGSALKMKLRHGQPARHTQHGARLGL